jgi:Major tropism determinant N-terminal domain
MPLQFQFRRGNTSQNSSFTGAVGELSIDTTLKQIRLHDGSTAGGTVVAGYATTGSGNVVLATGATLATPIINSPTINTATIVGSTVNSSTINTATIIGSTINSSTINTATIVNPTITNYTETVYTATTATITINLANGTIQEITLNANGTITLPSSVAGKSFTVIVTYSGSYSLTWAGGSTLKWAGGTTPTATATSGKYDIFNFYQDGTNTYGSVFGLSF